MVSAAEADVSLDHRLVQVTDEESDEALPTPRQVGHLWVSVGRSAVLLESAEDIFMARFFFESWDGLPPPLNIADWPVSEVIRLHLPSGLLAASPHGPSDLFDVGEPGRYQVRLAWRAGERKPDVLEPEAFALFQFWMDVTG